MSTSTTSMFSAKDQLWREDTKGQGHVKKQAANGKVTEVQAKVAAED